MSRGLVGVIGKFHGDFPGIGTAGLCHFGDFAGIVDRGADGNRCGTSGNASACCRVAVIEHFNQIAVADLVGVALVGTRYDIVFQFRADILTDGNSRKHGAVNRDIFALRSGASAGLRYAVDIEQRVMIRGEAQILVDVADFLVAPVSLGERVGILADLIAPPGPFGGRPSEIVALRILDQTIELQLRELDNVVSLTVRGCVDVGRVGVGGVPCTNLGGAAGRNGGNGGAVDNQRGVAVVVLYHVALQGVERQQGGLFTGQSGPAVEIFGHTVQQAHFHGAGDYVRGPSGSVAVLLHILIIAQSAQQHFQESVAAEGIAGMEGAVGVAGDEIILRAVGDCRRESVC